MIIPGAHDYECYYSLYEMEHVKTRLDILTLNLYTNILQTNDCLYKMEFIQKLQAAKKFDILCCTSHF